MHGAPQKPLTVEEGDAYSKVVKRVVLKSDSEQTEVSQVCRCDGSKQQDIISVPSSSAFPPPTPHGAFPCSVHPTALQPCPCTHSRHDVRLAVTIPGSGAVQLFGQTLGS